MVLPFKKWWMAELMVPTGWPGVFSRRFRFFALCFGRDPLAMDEL
jgi:hypothetical protein